MPLVPSGRIKKEIQHLQNEIEATEVMVDEVCKYATKILKPPENKAVLKELKTLAKKFHAGAQKGDVDAVQSIGKELLVVAGKTYSAGSEEVEHELVKGLCDSLKSHLNQVDQEAHHIADELHEAFDQEQVAAAELRADAKIQQESAKELNGLIRQVGKADDAILSTKKHLTIGQLTKACALKEEVEACEKTLHETLQNDVARAEQKHAAMDQLIDAYAKNLKDRQKPLKREAMIGSIRQNLQKSERTLVGQKSSLERQRNKVRNAAMPPPERKALYKKIDAELSAVKKQLASVSKRRTAATQKDTRLWAPRDRSRLRVAKKLTQLLEKEAEKAVAMKSDKSTKTASLPDADNRGQTFLTMSTRALNQMDQLDARISRNRITPFHQEIVQSLCAEVGRQLEAADTNSPVVVKYRATMEMRRAEALQVMRYERDNSLTAEQEKSIQKQVNQLRDAPWYEVGALAIAPLVRGQILAEESRKALDGKMKNLQAAQQQFRGMIEPPISMSKVLGPEAAFAGFKVEDLLYTFSVLTVYVLVLGGRARQLEDLENQVSRNSTISQSRKKEVITQLRGAKTWCEKSCETLKKSIDRVRRHPKDPSKWEPRDRALEEARIVRLDGVVAEDKALKRMRADTRKSTSLQEALALQEEFRSLYGIIRDRDAARDSVEEKWKEHVETAVFDQVRAIDSLLAEINIELNEA